jgi:hypothetical protein
MRFLTVLIVAILMLGCKKKEAPKPPESALLTFPNKNSECTTGQEINATSSQVEFTWQASNNTETYELTVTNLNNGNKQDITTPATSAKLPLEKGTPYSWTVISKNSNVLQTASSETRQFYNSGFETTYAPFPALILEPKMGTSVFKNINNDITIEWVSADVDNDILGFDLYFSTENPPETLISSPGANEVSTKVAVTSDTVYYWKIITKDSEGNTSDSGIFEFRAL